MSGFGGFGSPQKRKKRAGRTTSEPKGRLKNGPPSVPCSLFCTGSHKSLPLKLWEQQRIHAHMAKVMSAHGYCYTQTSCFNLSASISPHFSPEKLQSCCNQILLVFPTILLLLGEKRRKLRSNTNTSLALTT